MRLLICKITQCYYDTNMGAYPVLTFVILLWRLRDRNVMILVDFPVLQQQVIFCLYFQLVAAIFQHDIR